MTIALYKSFYLLTYLLKVHENASFRDQLDRDNSSPDAGFSARKAPENVWRPGSARTRWGSLSAPPDPLAAKKGRGRGKGKGKEGKRKVREGKEMEGKEEGDEKGEEGRGK